MPDAPAEFNIRSLECFCAIMESGSATAAGEKIGITQPAVSRLLALLEERIGFQLFHRSKGRLIPCEEAQILYPEIEKALANLGRISSLASNLGDLTAGKLNVVAPQSLIEGPLAGLISRYIEAHPGVKLTLDVCRADVAVERVLRRAADCGLVKLPCDNAELDVYPLFESGTACVISSHHPLAAEQQIQLEMLSDQPLVLLGQGGLFRAELESLFRQHKLKLKVRLDVHTVGTACAFARMGVGIAVVNEVLANHYADDSVVIRPLRCDIRHQYGFITASRVPMSLPVSRFFSLCTERLSSIPV